MDQQLLDILWIVVASGLVFLMQPGFMCLESGLTRSKNSINVAVKNISDLGISVSLYWLFGFALMYGTSVQGLIGSDQFLAPIAEGGRWLAAFFVFQAMFCGTATTIVSGAVAERLRFSGFLVAVCLISGVIYPVFGHWAWGGFGNLSDSAFGWLAQRGFVDFAGSSVVHGIGAWVSLAAIIVLGARQGRFPQDGPPQEIPGHNLPMSILGTLLLWIGWIGFNGGSTLAFNDDVPMIIGNTMIAGVAGLVTALLAGVWMNSRADVGMIMNGALAGLVAITANCHAVTAASAVLIGAIGAVLMVGATKLLERFRIDDVIGAVPVHGVAGAWGTIAVALFGNQASLHPDPSEQLSFAGQLGIQLLGVAICFVWGFGPA